MSDFDTTPLNKTVMDVCGIPLEIITPDYLNRSINYYPYIKIEKLSFKKPYLEYKFVVLIEKGRYVVIAKKFYPNPYGYKIKFRDEYINNDPGEYCINMAFLTYTKKIKLNPIKLQNISFMGIPSPVSIEFNPINTILLIYVVPLFTFFGIFMSINQMCEEQKYEIHTYMIGIGMNKYLYLLSYLTSVTLKMLVLTFGFGICLIIDVSGGWWIYIHVLFFGYICIVWVMIINTIFTNDNVYQLLSIFIFFIHMLTHFVSIEYDSLLNISGIHWTILIINPYSAYRYSIQQMNLLKSNDIPLRFFDSSPYYPPCIVSLACLVIQAVFYTILAFYLDYILPLDNGLTKHPLFFLGFKKKSKILNDDIEGIKEQESRFAEYFEGELPGIVDVEVRNLTKKWPNGDVAVSNVSFNAYRGQVTTLLGHNGAGKSTVFGCLTGVIPSTSGEIRIGNGNRKIGYCPQWNPIFPYMAIEDHLQFYGTLKTGEKIPEDEINNVLKTIDLFPIRCSEGQFLSEGMKRKLCVGIAMIGQSEILLLDEPTSGMDPKTRNEFLEILEKVKLQRTVIMTTHNMYEADLISDKIIIMAKGAVVCNGSSNFLKSQFNVGFVLSIKFNFEITEYGDREELGKRILYIAKECCPGAKIEGAIASQFKIILPDSMQNKFAGLFQELEQKKEELRIDAFGIERNSLEQVFNKITNQADPEVNFHIRQKVKKFLKVKANRVSGFELFKRQIWGLVLRKIHSTKWSYNVTLLLLTAFVPVLLLFDSFLRKIENSSVQALKSGYMDLNIDGYPKMVVPIIHDNSTKLSSALNNVLNDWGDTVIVENWSTNGSNHLQRLIDRNKDLPPIGFSIMVTQKELIFYTKFVLIGGRSLAIQALTEAISINPGIIKTTIGWEKPFHDLENIFHINEESTFLYMIIAVFSPIIFLMILSTISSFHSQERQKGNLHLYRLTQMSQFTYWLVAYITDFIISYFWIMLLILLLFGLQLFSNSCLPGFLIAVAAILFALLFQTYFIIFFFKNAKGNLIIPIMYNVFSGYGLFLLGLLLPIEVKEGYDIITHALFPIKSLIQILSMMINTCLPQGKLENHLLYVLTLGRITHICDNAKNFCYIWFIYVSLISGCIYMGLMSLIMFYRNRMIRPNPDFPEYTSMEDPDIYDERHKVERSDPKLFGIYLLHMQKAHKNGITAVKDLTLGIPKGECFGLLGSNGAGKSTLFNMLAGTLKSSSGIGYIGNTRIDQQPKFGFCSQQTYGFDYLTVKETIMLFTHFNGIKNSDRCVELILEALIMSHKSTTLVKNCSGGERRRLSVAIALITSSDILLLDEPTTGIDPMARRNIWDILIRMRDAGSTQLISSHSIEECEALCTRIGFLDKGGLKAIGTSQYVKEKFGKNYILTLTLKTVNAELNEQLDFAVTKQFHGNLISSGNHVKTLSWTIPKCPGILLSTMYHDLEVFVERWKTPEGNPIIADFSLIEASLEQVFTILSRKVCPLCYLLLKMLEN